MKRTYFLCVKQKDGQYIPTRKITCEVTGEMNDKQKTKVWTDIETGEQYWCSRICGHYMFYKG